MTTVASRVRRLPAQDLIGIFAEVYLIMINKSIITNVIWTTSDKENLRRVLNPQKELY